MGNILFSYKTNHRDINHTTASNIPSYVCEVKFSAMRDIESKEDLELIVSEFYKKLLQDELVKHFFTEVVQLNLSHHLPVIVSFWDSMLLGANTYKGNPMVKHFELNSKSQMERAHFDRWLQVWEQTIQTHFRGKVADEAIIRAKSIALLMHHKMNLINNKN